MGKDLKNKTCCFTGHRNIEKKDYNDIEKKLKKEIIRLINMGVCYFGCGGAIGFDTIAALTVLKLKNEYPNIRLIMVLPCPEQDKYWSYDDKKIYEEIKNKADKITYTSECYNRSCMLIRNKWLVDNSGYCIAYCNKDSGGTAYTVKETPHNSIKQI